MMKICGRQINLLNRASICTIDSFCLEIVRNNFYELENVSPNFRIADITEINLLKQEVIEDLFEEKYESDDENFKSLINTYTNYKEDTSLKELVLNIYTYIQSHPFPEKWLNEKVEMFNLEDKLEEDFSNTPWGEILLKQIKEELTDDILTLKEVKKDLDIDEQLEPFFKTVESDIKQIENLINNLDNWDKAYEIVNNIDFDRWPSRPSCNLEIKDVAKDIRTDVRKKVIGLRGILICDSKAANKDIYKMYNILYKLEKLILEFDEEFSKRKREKNIVDFSDVEHFALQILNESEEVRKKYQEKFEEIAIDEYQDSNLVQEYILTSISRNNNIFMVGDVKQSIYKFRQARPELFLGKYETYKKKEEKQENDDLKIQLFKNFRSKENILKFTNKIFENIMSKELGDIDYTEEEYLNLGADYEKISQDENIEINIIDASIDDEELNIQNQIDFEEVDQEEDIDNLDDENIIDVELEAKFVANKIKRLIESKYQVWDKNLKKYRDITYKDIVILLRATSNSAPVYEQELLNLQLPVFSDSSQEYLDSLEIQTIMNLLKIIDNPIQDIPLVSVMRSNIGKFTDNELIQIKLAGKYDNFYRCIQKARTSVDEKLRQKIEEFLGKLDMWRKEQQYLALDELIWKIYSDTGFYNYVGLMPNGILRQANLQMLFERAKQYETASFKGLYNFINFIEKLRLGNGDLDTAKIIGENDNVIRIMSIHKSKGLEFPVVFLSSTGKKFNLLDLRNNLLLHQDMGIGVKYIDYDRQIKYDTLSNLAVKEKVFTETLSEEMRILYVALTRAKEKLFITGIKKNYEKELEKLEKQVEKYEKEDGKINTILLKKNIRFIDWILLVYLYEKQALEKYINFNFYDRKQVLDLCEKIETEDINISELIEGKEINQKQIEEVSKLLNRKYKYELSTKIPTKTSVTKLKQKEDKLTIDFKPPKFTKGEEDTKLTGAQKGTLLHLCLQKLDIKKQYDFDEVENLIKGLINSEIITEIEAENINKKAILEFTKSNIWQEMKNAKEVYREKPFYITIPAKEIYDEDVEDMILVQGIIDLYYINSNDELVLVDYKTDFVESEKELIDRYKIQLDLYKRALEDALNKTVSHVYIYSTCLKKKIEIK